MKNKDPYIPIFILLLLLAEFYGCDTGTVSYTNETEDKLVFLDSLQNQSLKAVEEKSEEAIALADSAIQIIRNASLPDSLVLKFNDIKVAYNLATNNQIEVLSNLMESYLLCKKNNNIPCTTKYALEITKHYDYNYQPLLAKPFIEEAADFQDELPASQKAETALRLGLILSRVGSNVKAQKFMEKAIMFWEKSADTLNLAKAYTEAGYNLIYLRQTGKALEYTQKGFDLLKAVQKDAEGTTTFINLAINYSKLKPENGYVYLRQAIKAREAAGNYMGANIARYNLGNYYQRNGQYAQANILYDQVMDFSKKNKVAQGVIYAKQGKANVLFGKEEYARAIPLYEDCAEWSLTTGYLNYYLSNAEPLGACYIKTGRFADWERIRKKQTQIKSELIKKEQSTTLDHLNEALSIIATNRDKVVLQQAAASLQKKLRLKNIFFEFLIGLSLTLLVLFAYWKKISKTKERSTTSLLDKYRQAYKKEFNFQTVEPLSEQEYNFRKLTHELFEQQKIHLDPDLNMEKVIANTGFSYYQFNSFLKKTFQSTFSQMVKTYRVEEVKRILGNPHESELSIDEIAKKAGFSTRQNLHRAFLQVTGVTPGTFRNYLQNKRM